MRAPARIDSSDVRLSFLADTGRREQAELGAVGRFRVALPAHDRSQAFVGVGERDCNEYPPENGETGLFDSATRIELGEEPTRDRSIGIPETCCSIPIRGSLTAPNPDLTKFLKLSACNLSSGCAQTVAGPGARFGYTVPRPGAQRISITDSTGQCTGCLHDGALTARNVTRRRATPARTRSLGVAASPPLRPASEPSASARCRSRGSVDCSSPQTMDQESGR